MKFFLLVCILIISTTIFSTLGIVLASFLYDIKLFSNPAFLMDFSNPLTIEILKMLQVLNAIATFIIPALIISVLCSKNPTDYLKLNRGVSTFSLLFVILILFSVMPFINWTIEINEKLNLPEFLHPMEEWMKKTESRAAELTKAFLIMENLGDLAFNLFMIGLLPAVGEELLFRGIVQRWFFEWTKNVLIAIILTSVLFSALHMQFYGFLPRFILGVLLGYFFVLGKSLWLPVFAHFINNGSAVVFTYLNANNIVKFSPDNVGATLNSSVLITGSLLISLLLLFALYKVEKNRPYNYTIDSDT